MPTLIMTGENEVGSTPLMSEGVVNSNYILLKMQKETIEQAVKY